MCYKCCVHVKSLYGFEYTWILNTDLLWVITYSGNMTDSFEVNSWVWALGYRLMRPLLHNKGWAVDEGIWQITESYGMSDDSPACPGSLCAFECCGGLQWEPSGSPWAQPSRARWPPSWREPSSWHRAPHSPMSDLCQKHTMSTRHQVHNQIHLGKDTNPTNLNQIELN